MCVTSFLPCFCLVNMGIAHVSGWCQDGNTSARTITELSILSSTSFQMGKTFWWVVSAAVEQSRRNVNVVAPVDGKYGIHRQTPESLQTKKKWG